MDEIRLALRRIVTRPAAAIASILTLASAIGAASATWSLLSALLLHPLQVNDADTLVMVGQESPSFAAGRAVLLQTGMVYPWYPLLRDSGIFERTTAVWAPPRTLLVDTGVVANVPSRSSCTTFSMSSGYPSLAGAILDRTTIGAARRSWR